MRQNANKFEIFHTNLVLKIILIHRRRQEREGSDKTASYSIQRERCRPDNMLYRPRAYESTNKFNGFLGT